MKMEKNKITAFAMALLMVFCIGVVSCDDN